jgi:hypothetical protein
VILAPDEALLPRKSVPVGPKWPELFGPGKLKLNDPLGGTYAALAGNLIASPTSIAPNPAATICPALLIFLPATTLSALRQLSWHRRGPFINGLRLEGTTPL